MSSSATDAEPTPEVTVIMACRNVEAFIDDAVRSVRRQTMRDLQLVVAEDGSTDGTLARLEAHAREDPRVRVLALNGPSGAGAARNAALAAARGRWIAVLDGDDYMHPERLERLLAFAGERQAEIVADNQVVFDEAADRNPRLMFRRRPARLVSLAEMVLSNELMVAREVLGYLKPLVRRDVIAARGVRYDEALPIGEDYDFLARLMAGGAALWLTPQPLYFYRRYPGSTSHRWKLDDIAQMARADAAFRAQVPTTDPQLIRALDRRDASVRHVAGSLRAIEALKARDYGRAFKEVSASAAVARLVAGSALDGARSRIIRRGRGPRPVAPDGNVVTFITRQRISGANNGSSAYLISLANSLKAVGFRLHLIGPSKTILGRWPGLRLCPEMAVFDQIRFRGCVRLGAFLVRASPTPFVRAVRVALERLAGRLGVNARLLQTRKAPYAVSAPWEDEDFLYLGRHVAPSKLLMADYCYQTPALPYALQPSVGSLVIMHDLFWRRRSDFVMAGLEESSHSELGQVEEMKLLGEADVVLAIQAQEAALVRESLPDTPVIVTPVPAAVARRPSPGSRPVLLFVGSDTAANLHGAEWFLKTCWPEIRRRRPDAELWIAGGVRNSLDVRAPGVSLLGIVPDIAAVYERAAVVVSPLILGSGLKVKLIEALGMGKAVVATKVTISGVEDLVDEAVLVADDPASFSEACIALLEDEVLRLRLGEVAIDIARKHFSSPACHRGFLEAAQDLAGRGGGAGATGRSGEREPVAATSL